MVVNWGSIGELVGAIAVVVTLGYLAIQIRYARMMASDASRQSRADGVLEMQIASLSTVWSHDPLIKMMVDPGFAAWVDGVLATPSEA